MSYFLNFFKRLAGCRLSVLIIVMAMAHLHSNAQQSNEVARLAQTAIEEGDYFLASDVLEAFPIKDSNNVLLAHLLAEAYRFGNNYIASADWYAYVVKSDTSYQHPEDWFYLAMMLKSQAAYDSATYWFKQGEIHFQAERYSRMATIEVQACQAAIKATAHPIPYKISHLPREVNSPYSEFAPLQLGDSVLLFSSLQQMTSNEYGSLFPSVFLSKIWISTLTSAGYKQRKLWDHRLNHSSLHTANLSLASNLLFYTQCSNMVHGKMNCELYMCERLGKEWQAPVRLDNQINLKGYTATQPCFIEDSAGNAVLYFVSDRPGGFGGNDIWYSIYKNKHFYPPSNAGSTINTSGDEITPFYHVPDQTLYFSSDAHFSMGGFDVFKSKGGLNSWTRPENMGYPLNTACNEMYFVVNDADSEGYFTSNRPGSYHIKGATCCNDIYAWELKSPKIDSIKIPKDTIIYTKSIRKLLPIDLYFHNDEPDPATNSSTTEKNYEQCLSAYLAMKEIYLKEYAKGRKGNQKLEAEQAIVDFFHGRVEKAKVQLDSFLLLLQKDLEQGNQVAITVKGYTSPLNNYDYNLNLSKRRISSFINYLRYFHQGELKGYMDSLPGRPPMLTIHEEPLGKSMANKKVSDDPNDIRNSVYSPDAALERKIQILYYDSYGNKLQDFHPMTQVQFELTDINLGEVFCQEKKVIRIAYKNTGKIPLTIENVYAGSEGFSFDFPTQSTAPGDKAVLYALFVAGNVNGEFDTEIQISGNWQAPVKLKLHAMIKARPVPPPPPPTGKKKVGTK